MMKIIYTLLFLISLSNWGTGQNYHAKNGSIHFKSEAPSENITSSTNKIFSTLHTGNGKVSCAIFANSFVFEKPMMYKHFNEDYLESSKYPKATFEGYIKNMQAVNFLVLGQYRTAILGELTLHGISRNIIVDAQVFVTAKNIRIKVAFDIRLKDFGITIPDFVKDNLAEKVSVTVDVVLWQCD